MKRFYISPIVGTGAMTDPYRAKIQQYGLPVTTILPVNPNTGVPLFPWALCIAAGPNHTAVQADAQIDTLPDITLDSTLSVLTNQQRTRVLTMLGARGVDTTGLGVNSTFREVLTRIGQRLDARFTPNAFDVAEPA